MRRFIGAGVLAAALVAGGAAQDGPVSIKIKRPAPGETVKETKTEKAVNKIALNIMGMAQNKDEEGAGKFVFTDEIVERPAAAKKPTKLKRTYETAELTEKGEAVNLGLAGKTVVVEKKGDKYEFTIDGSAVGGKAGELLNKEFNKKSDTDEEAFLPKVPVKVGDTWKPDLAELTKELTEEGMSIDVPKSTVLAKLTKVYKKGTATYGVVEVTMELLVTKVGPAGMEIPLNAGSKLTATVTLDGCIDGTLSNGTSKMVMKGDLSGEVMGVGLKIDLTATNATTVEEVKK